MNTHTPLLKSATMGVTEVKIKGEDQHLVLSRIALEHALKEGTVEALYKFGVYDREPVLPKGKRIDFQGDFLKEGRPVASSVISSVEIDRDGDVVFSPGMVVTDNFMKNPVVLPSHMHSFPVGFDLAMVQTDSLVWAKWQWTSDLPDTQGAIYQRLWEAHALNCTSIGFMILEWSSPEDIPGWKFIEWEILEHSPVVIPANREAMRTDGLKAFLKGYAEVVMEGPSPLVKQIVDENRELFLPKQVAVGGKSLMNEETEDKATSLGEATVNIKVSVEGIAEAISDAGKQPSLPFEQGEAITDPVLLEASFRADLACALGARGQETSEEAYTLAVDALTEFDGEIPEWKEYSPEELFALFPEQYAELMANEDWKEGLDHLCSAWSAGTLSKREFVFLVRLLVTSSIETVRQQAEELEEALTILSAYIVVHQ